ncbi:MAG: cytochrome c oxidase subunit II [Acetobacteraceae bacterium]
MQVAQRLRAAFVGIVRLGLGGLIGLLLTAPAWAQAPRNWELSFQKPHSPVQQGIAGLHAMVIWLMAMVTIFVACLLLFVVWRYNAKRNPKASRVSHHTALEVAWTLLPVLILVVIAIPSFRMIYFEDRTAAADLTIKVTGRQWAWEYAYPDQGGFSFISNMIADEDIKPDQLRRLDVDNRLVLPAGKNIRILTTSNDVIHSFFIPSLGVQRYAIPGRTIETWVKIDRPGVYYGECNQICGTNHSAMPIAIEAKTEQDFAAWAEQAKTKFADSAPIQPAGAPAADRGLTAIADAQR